MRVREGEGDFSRICRTAGGSTFCQNSVDMYKHNLKQGITNEMLLM